MSGIVGIYYPNNEIVESKHIAKMIKTLAHRGSDGSNIWLQESIGLGHLMLWTTPESLNEKLPFSDSTGNFVITADARIDNREELIPLLGLENIQSDNLADSQIILAAYQKWGEDCPNKLLGDFAFVIWDRGKQKLFCARDHFGVKPFYYYYQPEIGFVFASEIKAIVALPQISSKLNEVRIGDYLSYTFGDNSITSYQNIWRLPAAHTLTIDSQNDPLLNCYWQLEIKEKIELESDLAYAEKFREIFTEAVRCRLRSAFSVGSHLSGGLDSSSVACVARNLLREQDIRLHTFSNIFDSVPETDEQKYIETIVAQGEVEPHFVHADRTGPLSEWEEFFKFCDEPAIGNCYLVWGLNRAASQAKVRIVLNGFDGDTTVSHGLFRLMELAQAQNWQEFLHEGTLLAKNMGYAPNFLISTYGKNALKEFAKQGKWLAFFNGVNQISNPIQISPQKLIVECGIKSLIPQQVKQIWRKLRYGKSNLDDGLSLINPDFARRINLKNRIESISQDEDFSVCEQENHWFKLTRGSLVMAAEAMDTFAAAFSIESRHPFMDKRLIEYCLALPAEQKLCQGWSRMILRRAMENILPSEIQWRGGKSTVTPAMVKSLVKYDSDLLDRVILSESAQFSYFIEPEKAIELWQDSKFKGKYNGNLIVKLWPYLSLALWSKKKNLK